MTFKVGLRGASSGRMSTYQYYEFKALDRPLSTTEQAELRQLSSRAEITADRFVNVYNYGSFRGDPDRLMERYFDVFVYLASWGTRELQIRLPRRLFESSLAQPYLREDSLSLRTQGDHVILTFQADRQDEAGWTEGAGWLASLLPLRMELLAGDPRALYLGWLAGVSRSEEEEGEDEEGDEPPVPPGMGELSVELRALAEFLFVSSELLASAAKANPARRSTSVPKQALARWLSTLPVAEKDALLLRLLQGPEPLLGAELLQRFRAAHAPARAGEPEAPARRESEAWREVESSFAIRSAQAHQRGVQLLVDLRALAQHHGALAAFERKLAHLREANAHRRALLRRLDEAGLGAS
jgi:hypothetical protein